MILLKGTGVSSGIAVGSIYIHTSSKIVPQQSLCAHGEEEKHLARYETVKKKALDELEIIIITMKLKDPEKAKIFRAHQDIVNDVAINEEIPNKILKEHCNGDWAIYSIYETFFKMIKKAKDPLIAERAVDFEDVSCRLLRLWHGGSNKDLSVLEKPVIIAARELLPSDTASMDANKVLAILTETGGITSHAAIIAKSFGIPAVLGIQNLFEHIKNDQCAAVNAFEGKIYLDPKKTVITEYTKKAEAWRQEIMRNEFYLKTEASTEDNVRIDIGINIANADEKDLRASEYCDSVGLFRTEFLYMGRTELPGEEEQFSVYKKVLERFGNKPVVLRTLDIGGDKTLQSMDLPKEENPFLGNRALRLCFSYPDIFKTQIRACLRASAFGNLWLMLPMVGSIDDIQKAKKIIQTIKSDLKKEGKSFGKYKIGIMIEIPSIALIADYAAQEVDFASIGSNDLCQYLCAADRMNSAVESYYQSYHPSLLLIIKNTVESFLKAGKPISICGELGGDPLIVPVFIGFGMRKLSMGASSVAEIKRVVSGLTIAGSEEKAKKALEFKTAEEIKRFLEGQ